MNKKNRIVLVFALIAAIFLAVYCFVLTERMKENEISLTELRSNLGNSTDKLSKISQVIRKLDKDYMARRELDDGPLYLDYKKKVAALLDENITQLIPEKPLHGGKWFVSKIDFISPSFVFVEYEDGHNLYAILIQVSKTDKGYSFKAVN